MTSPMAMAALSGVGGGRVAVGDLDTARGFEAAGQHAALQGQGGVVLAGVAQGVVYRDGGLGRHFLGIGQLVLLERAGVLRSPEADGTHEHAP
jgi:hypothetical protein